MRNLLQDNILSLKEQLKKVNLEYRDYKKKKDLAQNEYNSLTLRNNSLVKENDKFYTKIIGLKEIIKGLEGLPETIIENRKTRLTELDVSVTKKEDELVLLENNILQQEVIKEDIKVLELKRDDLLKNNGDKEREYVKTVNLIKGEEIRLIKSQEVLAGKEIEIDKLESELKKVRENQDAREYKLNLYADQLEKAINKLVK